VNVNSAPICYFKPGISIFTTVKLAFILRSHHDDYRFFTLVLLIITEFSGPCALNFYIERRSTPNESRDNDTDQELFLAWDDTRFDTFRSKLSMIDISVIDRLKSNFY
jgi:hypothetical protein